MTTLEDAWYEQERWATESTDALCLLDLRRRVEALEQRATPAPKPAPAADRPLWEVMSEAAWSKPQSHYASHHYAAEIDAVADWLAAREHCGAASALRAEARRAREGQ